MYIVDSGTKKPNTQQKVIQPKITTTNQINNITQNYPLIISLSLGL